MKNQVKNYRVTAWLASPLAGEPPMLDAILGDELACRLGTKNKKKIGRWTPPSEIEKLPIPLVHTNGIPHCSSPIIPKPAAEWTAHIAKRFDSSRLATLISEENRKSVLTTSGPYKSRFQSVRVRLIDRVAWFLRGDKEQVNKLLKSIHAVGAHRGIGYGQVWEWTFDEMEDDYSIFAPYGGKKMLMRMLPAKYAVDGIVGYKRSYGAFLPPYWHGGNMHDIIVPVGNSSETPRIEIISDGTMGLSVNYTTSIGGRRGVR